MDKEFVETCYLPAALKALQSFPVEAENVELVAQSENITFRVSVGGSDSLYALRLHRPDYNSIQELESERAWVEALGETDVLFQESLLTHNGQHFELIDIPATGEQRYAGMTTWLEGALLSDYLDTSASGAERERIFRRIGEMAAAMHNQATSWDEPPGFTRRRLDIDGLLGEAPVWGRFWEHSILTDAEQTLLLQAREAFRSALAAYGEEPDSFGLVHADLHPANIVYDGEHLGLIDFDDSAYGWHMYDIASALIEYKNSPDFEVLRAALLEGYRKYRPLQAKDVELLHMFVLIRGMAIIGWFHERPEHAGSDYFAEIKDMVIDECGKLRGQTPTP